MSVTTLSCHLLFPFDLPLDYNRAEVVEAVEESGISAPDVLFDKRPVRLSAGSCALSGISDLPESVQARYEVKIFPFGVGLVILKIPLTGELKDTARQALSIQKAQWDGISVSNRAKSLGQQATAKLAPHVEKSLETCLVRDDCYPIYLRQFVEKKVDAESFVRKQEGVLAGLLAEEPDWDRLSEFTVQNLPLTNFGYYKDEAVLLSESGAFVASRYDNESVYQILEIAYAQRFALMAWNHLLNVRIRNIHTLFEQVRGFKWSFSLHRLNEKLFEAFEDRVELTQQIQDTTDIPKLQEDWHLARVYAAAKKIYDIDGLDKIVDDKIEQMERAYESVHDVLSERRTWRMEVLVAVLFIAEMILLSVWYWKEFSKAS